jgi:hypothetical protein
VRSFKFFLIAVATMVGLVTLIAPTPGHADGEPDAPYVTEIPHGYRDWKWVSSAHEAGNLNSLGAIIAALHYRNVASDENDKVFGHAQSFVPGAATNIQFMVKDSKKYAATGGWGFATFVDGKAADAASMKSCFPCHEKAERSDLVFTRYAP